MNRLLFWLGLLLCLGLPTGLVVRKELELRGSRVVYLRIAPSYQERSPVEGETIRLDYDLSLRPLDPSWPSEGFLKPSLDARSVINAWELDAAAAPGERIHYTVENSRVVVASRSFHIPTGHSYPYEEARYAKFELAKNGNLTLKGLTDSTLRPL